MVSAMFKTNQDEFGKASPDYADKDYLKGWDARKADFAELVPTGVHRATDKDVTKTMAQVAKSLRDPLNYLDLRLKRATKKGGLTASAADFGLGKVRSEISTRDMEGLDGALGHLLQLVQQPANLAALTTQGHTTDDTQALVDARKQLGAFNTDQNTNQNAALELTDENIKAGNALWEYVVDVLGTGALMYKEKQPKKAKTFSMATLLKRIRKENGGAGDVKAG
ncbi:hypothetical protein GCM10028824_10350 [Hymenobacter segetis]